MDRESLIFDLSLSWARTDAAMEPRLRTLNLPLSRRTGVPCADIPADWTFQRLVHVPVRLAQPSLARPSRPLLGLPASPSRGRRCVEGDIGMVCKDALGLALARDHGRGAGKCVLRAPIDEGDAFSV